MSWVFVTDNLPERFVTVRCRLKSGDIRRLYYSHFAHHVYNSPSFSDGKEYYLDVVEWKPLD